MFENGEEEEGIETGNAFHNYSLYSPTSMAAAAYNNLESPLSMVEKTAKRILPVVKNVIQSLIQEKPLMKKGEAKEGSGMAIEDEEIAEI